MPNDQLRRLADDYWDAYAAANPLEATVVGDRRFDDRLDDISPDAEAGVRATYAGMAERLAALDPAALDAGDRVTHMLLAEELRTEISLIDLRVWDMRWDQIVGAGVGLLEVIPELNAPTPESAAAVVERWRQVPRFLEQAAARHRHAVADGRTPQRVVLDRAINSLDSYLASPIEADGFVTISGPSDWSGEAEAEWRELLTSMTRDHLRPAFARYREVLARELRPAERPNDRCGLGWLADGEERYRALIRNYVGLDMDPREIHDIGMTELTQKLPAEYADAGSRAFGITDPTGVFERLLTDPALRYTTAQELLDDSAFTVDAGKAVMARWFGRLPVADCEVKPVPDHLAADSGSAYYFPPAADGSRSGIYYVNTYEPQQKTRFETASIACHEAIPGHHLQLAIATELEDLPRFQRFSSGHTAYVEGWGLYAERLADEMGLYRTDLDRIGMLTGDSSRCCRLVCDTGIHALGWSRDQAVDFMASNTPVSREEVEIEIDRYIAWPGQALAYKLGQREIRRLRDKAEAGLGDRFDIKGFHDTVLGSASVSLPVLASLVDDWIAAFSTH
jgi:uncharacterized protein (DUF885 family)